MIDFIKNMSEFIPGRANPRLKASVIIISVISVYFLRMDGRARKPVLPGRYSKIGKAFTG